jgi:small subunit ribosomal protein S20
MPITKGAHKALRASKRKHVFNVRRKATMNDEVKKLRKLAVAGQKAEAEKLLPAAYKAIDKAVKRGVIKKNTASRKKSRLSASIAKIK